MVLFLLSIYASGLHAETKAGVEAINYKLLFDEAGTGLLLEVRFKGRASGKTDVYIPMLHPFTFDNSELIARSGSDALQQKLMQEKEGCMNPKSSSLGVCKVLSVQHKPNAEITIV